MSESIFAGIDAGGTTFKCIVGNSPDVILAEHRVDVGEPQATLSQCVSFFQQAQRQFGVFARLGIGSFGPLDIHPQSSRYGEILTTPKPHWQGVNLVRYFAEAMSLDVVLETDVNAALMGEHQWGAAQGMQSAVYVTVGTGIGVGAMVDGRVLHGALHLEAGHMSVARHPDDQFQGICPFHRDCAEGLASGPAIAERWQQDPSTLDMNHPAWALEAHYLASLCVNLALVYSPQMIILGGGVLEQKNLLGLIRNSYAAQMNGYLHNQLHSDGEFVVAAGLGGRAGALGAIALARYTSA